MAVFSLWWEKVWTLALFPVAESGLKGGTIDTKVRGVGPTGNSSSLSPIQTHHGGQRQEPFVPYCPVQLMLGHDLLLLFRVFCGPSALLTIDAYKLMQQKE